MAQPIPHPGSGWNDARAFDWAVKLTQSLRARFAPQDTIPEVAAPSDLFTGMLILWPKPASIPTGWLQENTVVDRTTYAALFALIGTTFNTGGESGTQFRTPNVSPSVGAVANCTWIIKT